MEKLLTYNQFCIKISGQPQTDKNDDAYLFWQDLYTKYLKNPSKYIDIDGTPLGTFIYNSSIDKDLENYPETNYLWDPYEIKVDVQKTQEFLEYLRTHIGDTFSYTDPLLNDGEPELISLKTAHGWGGFNQEGEEDWNVKEIIGKPTQYHIQIGYVSEYENPIHWSRKKATSWSNLMYDTNGNLVDRGGEPLSLKLVENIKPIKKIEGDSNDNINTNLAKETPKKQLNKSNKMAKSIEQEIADLEKAINSPATPEAQKGVMKGILEKLKAKQGSAPKKTETEDDKFAKFLQDEKKVSKIMADTDKKLGIKFDKPEAKAPAKKSETGKLMVAEVMYRDASNYKSNYLFGILPEYVNDVKEGDEEVPVGYFGITNEQWEEFGRDWNDEFDHYSLEVMKVYPYENDEMIDNSSELAVNSVKWNEALKGTKKGKKIEPKTEIKKPTSEDDYDCDTLIEKEKTRRAKIKERALKKANAPKPTQATKNRDAIEKVGDKLEASIEKRLETGKVSKNELTKLIEETKALLKMLESYLDKVN